MRDQRPIRTARRKTRQREREENGLAVAPCVLCIEQHHTAGRNHDPELTDPLCEKHHRALHEQLRRAGVPLSFEPDPRKRVAKALRSVALYDRARADAMDRWAGWLDPPEGTDTGMNGSFDKRIGSNPKDEGLNFLLISIFKRALPVWRRYNGAVPPKALDQLDMAGDWPVGIAAATMQRLSRDPELRESLSAFKWRIEYE